MRPQSAPSAIPAPARIMQMLSGEFISKSLMVVSRLNVADQLARAPGTPDEIAKAVGADARSLYRVLRALASVGVFQEDETGRFSNTELSDALRSDVPGSMKAFAQFLCGGPMWAGWGELEHSVRTGRSGFERVHGKRAFDYMAGDPEFARDFSDAMHGLSEQETAAIHASFDFSAIGTLVDIAGGHGALLASCLERNPKQRGILFDRPSVVAEARAILQSSPVAARCELAGGDFFKEIISGGDAYMMKYILHDWKDEEALAILKNIHRAARKGAKLLVLDAIIEPGNAPDFGKLMDLQMLAFYDGGRERTRAEFGELFQAAGFRLARVTPTRSAVSILEAERE